MSLFSPLIVSIFIYFFLHTAIWFSINYQFTENSDDRTSLMLCIMLAIPISVSAFYATRFAYSHFQTAWEAKLFGFGIGYLVFPVLTWLYLNENPFTIKVILSIILAFTIVGIQLFFPDS